MVGHAPRWTPARRPDQGSHTSPGKVIPVRIPVLGGQLLNRVALLPLVALLVIVLALGLMPATDERERVRAVPSAEQT